MIVRDFGVNIGKAGAGFSVEGSGGCERVGLSPVFLPD
jgi:hypothetical protein